VLVLASASASAPSVAASSALDSSSSIASLSHGFFLRGVLSILLEPGSSTVAGISSMPGTGWLRVIKSTIAAKEFGYGGSGPDIVAGDCAVG